jgi:Family of unknown function (DUF6498)
MPVYDEREKQFPVLPFIILSNIFPLIGVLYYHMSFFMLFYLYWCETVIISIFNWIKMGKAKKKDVPDPGFTINNHPLTYQQVNSKKYMRRMYLGMRLFILFFYLIFIIVFIGFMQSMRQPDADKNALSVMQTLFFQDRWMQVSLLVFIILHCIQYWQWIMTKEYEETSLRKLGSPFDGRMIIMHIVIVLGTFLSFYATENLFPHNPNAGQIAFASLFVFLKVIVDVLSFNRNNKRSHTILETYESLVVRNK